MSQNRSQTHTVVLDAGTGEGTYQSNFVLDEQYQQCQGVVVYENSDGGVPNYKIGLKDSSETYQELTHKNDWIVEPSVAPNQRIKSLNPPVLGQKLSVLVQIPEGQVLTSELNIDVVFRLSGKKSR